MNRTILFPRSNWIVKPLVVAAACAVASLGGVANAVLLYTTNGSTLSRFDSAATAAVTTVPLTGLQAGETLVGIDTRPANSLLYGVGSTSRLYTLNPLTGVATVVGSAGSFTLNGTAFGTDFNPVPDRLRQVSNTEQNLRLNPNDGTLTATDTALNPAGNIVSVAYTNNFPGAASTTLFAIDSAAGTLNNITVPNSGGPITTIGSLGLGTNLNEAIGFDIVGTDTTGFAAITTGGVSKLYSINLATGAATDLGTIGAGTTPYLGLTAATIVPEPATGLLFVSMVGLFSLRRRRA